mgnify:CR=1 FL=1
MEYNLDRLGIPLLEIATDSSIKDPEHAKECAEIIGMIIKSTGKMRRGIGTIRQDVNISIKGHPRVEIKGFQDLKNMPFTINKEIERQLEEIKSIKSKSSDNVEKELEKTVRKAEPDGSTTFLRPMPGAARMYPETDVKKIIPDIGNIKIPELISEKKEKIEELGLGKDLAQLIAKEGKADLLIRFAERFANVKPSYIAETMLPIMKEIAREGFDTNKINEDTLSLIFSALNEDSIAKNSVVDIIKGVCRGEQVKDLISKNKTISDKELEERIKAIINAKKGAPFNVLMGEVMKELRGKADGKKISELVKKLSA